MIREPKTRVKKSDNVKPTEIYETSDGVLEADNKTYNEIRSLTDRQVVLYRRLLRVLELPEGYPERESAIDRHVHALEAEGCEAPREATRITELLDGRAE